jgi:hypothetical protein
VQADVAPGTLPAAVVRALGPKINELNASLPAATGWSSVGPRKKVVEATTHRFRPILLTAAAAILGMIPIAPTIFWGPMAYAIMGGLAVATLLTLKRPIRSPKAAEESYHRARFHTARVKPCRGAPKREGPLTPQLQKFGQLQLSAKSGRR